MWFFQIVAIDVNIDFEQLLSTYKTSEHKIREIYRLSDQEFLIPGFIDAHIHGPQFENAGLGYDKALLEWLKAYTFPLEKKFEDVNYATPVYEKVVVSIYLSALLLSCSAMSIIRVSILQRVSFPTSMLKSSI